MEIFITMIIIITMTIIIILIIICPIPGASLLQLWLEPEAATLCHHWLGWEPNVS